MSLKPFRSWSQWIVLGFLVLVGLSQTTPLVAQAQTKSYPVSLELLAPTSGGNRIPTVTNGGWPIVLKMSANREIGIGTQDIFGDFPISGEPGDFPISGDQGFVVFEEPDFCHSWVEPACPVNETYMSFNPGSCSGSQLPGAVPSLVLLADSRGGTNLANQFTVVGYELDDTSNQTNVVASLVIPSWFLGPPPDIDLCVGALLTPEGPCEDGARGVNSSGLVGLDQLVPDLNANNIATLRAFVVSATAPGFLSDLDGDAVTGAKDAELAGFRVISRELVFRVRTLYQVEDFRALPFVLDIDGNGLATCRFCSLCPGLGCAGGGGRLTPVPR